MPADARCDVHACKRRDVATIIPRASDAVDAELNDLRRVNLCVRHRQRFASNPGRVFKRLGFCEHGDPITEADCYAAWLAEQGRQGDADAR